MSRLTSLSTQYSLFELYQRRSLSKDYWSFLDGNYYNGFLGHSDFRQSSSDDDDKFDDDDDDDDKFDDDDDDDKFDDDDDDDKFDDDDDDDDDKFDDDDDDGKFDEDDDDGKFDDDLEVEANFGSEIGIKTQAQTQAQAQAQTQAQTQTQAEVNPFNPFNSFSTKSVLYPEEIRPNVYHIYQKDIDGGTLIIDKEGKYIVMEDLIFNPNPVGTVIDNEFDARALGLEMGDALDAFTAGRPLPSQLMGQYDPKAFGVGFFSAIAITSDNVTLNLNNHTLRQSEEHALLQRFYSNIETAGAPFVTGQGPHDFGEDGLKSADHLTIKNGTIGLSSHHGIHGNGNVDVKIKNVDFRDHEVAAVALNGVNKLKIKNSTSSNRTDVPVVGAFSNSRFISRYVSYLARFDERNGSDVNLSLEIRGEELTIGEIEANLQRAINSTYKDIIIEGDNEMDQSNPYYDLFANPTGLVEGNSYGYLVGAVGVQVNGFPVRPEGGFQTPSKNVTIKNTHVLSQKSQIIEVPILSNAEDGGDAPVVDPIGQSFQLRNKDNNVYSTLINADGSTLYADASSSEILASIYGGNPLADSQLIVAKAISQHIDGEFLWFKGSNLDVSRNTIGKDIIDWAESATPLSNLRESLDITGGDTNGWIYNVDNMAHVNKGTIGLKMDTVTGGVFQDISVRDISATGSQGFNGGYSVDEKGYVKQELTGYNGAAVRGITLAGASNVSMKEVYIDNLSSEYGEVYGIQAPTPASEISIHDLTFGPNGLIASGDSSFGPNHSAIAYDVSGLA